MDDNRLINVAATPLGIAPTITLSELANLKHSKACIIPNWPETLHSKPVM